MTDKQQDEAIHGPENASVVDESIKPDANHQRIDPEVAKYATNDGIAVSESESKRLKRMIDKRVLVVMVFTYFLQALDKGTLSFAAIMNLREDLNLHGQQYSWLTTCIYIAVLVVEYPTNLLIQRLPVAKYLSINIILWGSVLALHAACKNFASILALRTLLGIFEAVCQPAFLTMSSMWYKRDEQASIVTFWYMMNGTQQIVGGLLAYCFSLIRSGPVKGYQALFMTYGLFSVLWGIFALIWLPDSPMRARCFSEDDKKLMVERVRANQTGLQNKKWRREQFIEALTDPQTWGYCLVVFTTTLPTSGLGAFANIIITSFKYTVLQTQLLAMVLGVYIIIVLFSSTWIANKTQQTLLVMGVYVLPSVAGTIVLLSVENTGKATQVGLLFSYYIVLSFWAAQTLAMTLISRNIAGQTKKMVVTAMYFVTWSAGNAIGPQVFLDWNKPRYFIAFTTHMVCYVVLILDIIFLRWYLQLQNRRKCRSQGSEPAGGKDVVQAFGDFTDKENKSFRYVF